MTIEIKHRYTGEVLFSSSKTTVREAVLDALARGSDLRWSDLSGSNLRGSDLRWSDLSGSNLRGSDLRGSDLRGSNLRGSDLSGSDLSGSTTCLSVTGLPSGHAILAPLPEGWRLTVGCWSGTVAELRELIAQDDDWPEATGEQITLRRPMLAALADMCDAWIVTKSQVLQEIQDKWGTAAVAK